MDILLKLTPKRENLDYIDLITKLNRSNISEDYDIGQVQSVIHSYKGEIVNYIVEHGLSSLINSELLLEHVVRKGATQNQIVAALHKYLDKLGVDDELIIVDPYFFAATSDTTYPATVKLALDKYLPHVDTLHIVTYANKVDQTLKSTIENNLKTINSSINIIHKTSSDYHDRFWISNKREKGILTGTSLNGYGKKYALLDRLNTSDVREIVSSLQTNGIL